MGPPELARCSRARPGSQRDPGKRGSSSGAMAMSLANRRRSRAGITRDTKASRRRDRPDESGNPTGIFKDTRDLVARAVPDPLPEQKTPRSTPHANVAEKGVTSVHNMGSWRISVSAARTTPRASNQVYRFRSRLGTPRDRARSGRGVNVAHRRAEGFVDGSLIAHRRDARALSQPRRHPTIRHTAETIYQRAKAPTRPACM